MAVDFWQIMGSLAALAFTFGFADQVRVTFRSKNVDGLSQLQWMMFAVASTVFTAYYVHLAQWMMVAVSLFGVLCCLSILGMIYKFRRVTN